MEATKYVEINEMGSAVVFGTRIHVEAVAHAYTGGYTEQEILDWLKINRVQLHGALAYYYEHQDDIEQRIQNRIEKAALDDNVETDTLTKLRQRSDENKSD
ncbi:MAG: DUF433 domain-containing protein [Anaerolineae bacterium]|nr:DUF433 domain-containing protein [Anaerolineae bacterium]MDQ7034517.1 DUF433 domain-containing protein [Anaerolineae bacterium]